MTRMIFALILACSVSSLFGKESDQDICRIFFKGASGKTCKMPENFPMDEGSLEIRFKPEFPQNSNQETMTLMELKGKSTNIKFYFKPNGICWIFNIEAGKWRKEVTLWHHIVKENEWNNVLLTWNKNEKPRGKFNLYLNGKWRNSAIYDRKLAPPLEMKIFNDNERQKTEIDRIIVYGRCMTKDQAKVLSGDFDSEKSRLDALRAKLKSDDEIIQKRKALIAQLKGKVGRLLHMKRFKDKEIKLPEGIVATAINPQDIGRIDLSQFKVILFPQGPRYEVDPEQYKYIVDYVKNGGGYVGSCQGSYFANKLGLLDFKCYLLDIWGIFAISLKKGHVVTDWQEKKQIYMHFGNGPVMVPGKDVEVLATYVMGYPNKETTAAIITGKCGKGRVVLFGPHPMGGKVSRKGIRAYFSGKDLETERMMVNALLYAAGLLENKK